MYYAIAGIIFFATLAMTVQGGIWNNLITLLSIVVGGVVAFGFFQPAVVYIDQQTEGSYTYLLDLPVLWFLFAVTAGLMINLSGLLSKTKVEFNENVEKFGGPAIGLVAAYAMMCFTMSTMHMAPLGYDMFSSGYEYGTSPAAAEKKLGEKAPLTTPDIAWLSLSDLVFQPAALGTSEGFKSSIFVSEYGNHREKFGSMQSSIVKRR